MRKLIHKEGRKIIAFVAILMLTIDAITLLFTNNSILQTVILVLSALILLFVMRFFRIPNRIHIPEENIVFSPADGEVVAVEERFENEYLKKKCMQISVFMSVWNIHINWFPFNGEISYSKYHPGKFLIARHPKSSELNERNSIVIKTDNKTEILVRQIAGFVARRIVSYATLNKKVSAGEEIGFIKFGSRVDIFLPLDSNILVKPGDKVKGTITKLAMLKKA